MIASTSTRAASRRGLTLIEVLLATAILAMSLAALGQLQSTGMRAAIGAQLEATAIQLCQTELDTILAGKPASLAAVSPAGSAAVTPLVRDPSWSRRAFVEPTATPGLVCVTVEIYRPGTGNAAPLATLSTWVSEMASEHTGGDLGSQK